MSNESTLFLQLLERRLALLEGLTAALSQARRDLVAMDLESLRAGIREQERLCGTIRTLDGEISAAQRRAAQLTGDHPGGAAISWPLSPTLEAPLQQQLRATLERLAQTQRQVRRANDEHQALLRRSGRTVGVLLNLLQGYAPTYSMPPAAPCGTLCEERV